MADDDILSLHLAACTAQLAWYLVPRQSSPTDLALLAQGVLADPTSAFDVLPRDLPSASQLLIETESMVFWRGEVDAVNGRRLTVGDVVGIGFFSGRL